MALRHLLAGGLLLCSIAASAAAEHNYVYVGGSDSQVMFIDANSMQRSGKTVDFWVLDVETHPKPDHDYALVRYRAFCGENEWETLYFVFYPQSGTPQSGNGDLKRKTIVPDTVGEQQYDGACKGFSKSEVKTGIRGIPDAVKVARVAALKLEAEGSTAAAAPPAQPPSQ